MAIFNFISTKPFFMCNVGGIAINITDQEYITIDVELATNSELLILARGVEYGYLLSNNNLAFEEYYTNLIGDISSYGSGGSSGQGPDVDATNATNITSGTLSNARLTTNLTQIGNDTFANGEIIQSFGGVLQNASLVSGTTGIYITNSAGQILFDAPYAKGPLSQKSGIFEDFITYSATTISQVFVRNVSGIGATTTHVTALPSSDLTKFFGSVIFPAIAEATAVSGATKYTCPVGFPDRPSKFLGPVRKEIPLVGGANPIPLQAPQNISNIRTPAPIIPPIAPRLVASNITC